jgi:hypothetical protein
MFKHIIHTIAKYFDKISIFYHLFFFTFLLWVLYLKAEETHIPKWFVKLLGIYILLYGSITFFFGHQIFNKLKIKL